MKPKKIEEIITSPKSGAVTITLKSGKEIIYYNGYDDEAIIEGGDTLKLTTEVKKNKWLIIYIDCDDISAISYETT